MQPEVQQLLRVTAAVRKLFHRMGNQWNDLHRDLGVSARMRAVLEALGEGGRAVPDLAREKEVSRQHIQIIVNELLEAGFVRRERNPAHRRSPLIEITQQGRAIFEQLAARERRLFPEVARELETLGLSQAADALEALLAYFETDQWRALTERHQQQPKEDTP